MREAPEILSFPVGVIDVNCYLVYPRADGPLYIIDPGGSVGTIRKHIGTFPAKEYRILLTHAHVDHISGLGELTKALGVKEAYVHPDDLPLYNSPLNELQPVMPRAKDLPPTAWPPPDNGDFEVIETPGHTPGGVCYYFPLLKAVFTGDTLFAGSIGRTDLPGCGEYSDLILSITQRLMRLPDETRVFPGHGPETTVRSEKTFNPYLVRA